MHHIQNLLCQEDTKEFINKTNLEIRRFIFYALKNVFNPKKSVRYLKKARSLKKNKKANNFPHDFVKGTKRVAVYTALYGSYDKIQAIKKKNSLCDYFIFTDQNVNSQTGWTLKFFDFPKSVGENPVLKNRFLKMHPHLLFPEYDYSIYIDSNIIIELDILRLLSRVGDSVIAMFHHHAGVKCLYDEAERIKRIGIAPTDVVNRQIDRYRQEGFPKKFGFFECSIIVRKHNDLKCISTMNTWWDEFLKESKRDQLSFMYAVWKNKLSAKEITPLGITFWVEPILSGISHIAKRDLTNYV